jgi:two-component system, cell cycle sensor histidine kinase and response regulator CckA
MGPQPPRALIVEDDDSVRLLLRAVLERGGWRVFVARDANEALAAGATGGELRLLLCDVLLPGKSGPALYSLLRESHPGLRVLFVSGDSRDSLVGRGLLLAESEFLQKPFTPQELLRRARAVSGVAS